MPTRTIEAIFYTRFHHEKGSRVLYQVPPSSIVPRNRKPGESNVSPEPEPFFDFLPITQNLIPNQQFCDRLLTFCVNHHRVIGYPVCIKGERYSRNEFIFNLAIVVNESEQDWACYGEVVRKLGRLLRGLEEQGGFLSKEEEGVWEDGREVGEDGQESGGAGMVYALCEMVLEDLNNYAECMIPIDDSNTINLKLFPTRPPPPPILAHQVPVLTISLSSLQSPVSSDLTLNRVLPYINGINSIARISRLADTDLSLTRRAIQHLVYYGCLVLLDIFSFGAIYACTAEIGGFVSDDDVKEECARYVRVPRLRIGSEARTVRMNSDDEHISRSSSSASLYSDTLSSTLKTSDFDNATSSQQTKGADVDTHHIDHTTLIILYTSLRQGLTLQNWVLNHLQLLQGIDVRRFITFGIIKGFLYRVHKYALTTCTTLPPAPPTSLATSAVNVKDSDTATVRANIHAAHPSFSLHRPSAASTTTTTAGVLASHQPQPQPQPQPVKEKEKEKEKEHSFFTDNHNHNVNGTNTDTDKVNDATERENGLPLLRFLDGMHCFDEMCTELGLSERVVDGKVRGLGEGVGVVIQR